MRILFFILSVLLVMGALAFNSSAPSPVPTSSAGPDRSVFTNEPISLDGTAASGWFDGLQSDGRYSSRWDMGYGGWEYQGGDRAPIAYPKAGSYTVTRTVCDQAGSCASDTATITVTDIICTTQVTLTDSGNPVTNMASLQSEVDSSTATATKCVNLPAGAIYRGTLTLKHRTSATYLTIRTTGLASLPTGVNRVSPSNASVMAIMETSTNAQIITTPEGAASSTPARYYSFIGIHFRKTSATAAYTNAFVNIGQGNETALNQLPNHLIFDRCYFDGGSTTSNTLRGILFRASDAAVVNSYFHRFKGVAIETQAVLTVNGERQAFINNFMEGATENYMAGGAGLGITNHNPTDIVFLRNYLKKDLGWCSFCGSYYGVNMSVKNLFELKAIDRGFVAYNRFENHWIEDQSLAIVFTPRNHGSGGSDTWTQVKNVDFAFNKILKIGNGMNIAAVDDLQPAQPTNHIIVRHNVFAGMSYYNGQNLFWHLGGGQTAGDRRGFDRVFLVRNSTDLNAGDGQGRLLNWDQSINNTNFFLWANVGQGFLSHNNGTGTTAMSACCTSSSVLKNGFYRSVGTNPTGNSAVSLITDVRYQSVPGFELSLLSDSPFLTTGLLDARAGADVATLNTLTISVINGDWESAPTPTPTPTPTATPTPTPTPTATPTPTPDPSPTPTPTPGRTCRPNELISSGCTCTTKIVGPPNKRRCK